MTDPIPFYEMSFATMTKTPVRPLESNQTIASIDGPPVLSVVVPCRNERAHIEATMASILNQKGIPGRLEIIVVDGQSDDGTREHLETLRSSNDQLRVIDNPDRITPSAMNLGIAAARGQFVAILGAHTEYAHNYLATCLDLLDEHLEADCVGGPIESRGWSSFGRAVSLAMSHPMGVGNARHRFPDYEGYVEGACFPVFRREVLARIGKYDPALVRNQDDDYNFRLRAAGGKIYISPRARSVYYVRDTLSALFKQYFQYGYWRLRVLQKHRKIASWRQLAPVLFFGSLMIAVPLTLVTPPPWKWIWAVPLLIYLLLLIASALSHIPHIGLGIVLRLPLVMFAMHLGYASGFVFSWFTRSTSARSFFT